MFDSVNRIFLSILHVEDDDADAKMIRRAFRNARIENEIIRVRNGFEAMTFLSTREAEGDRDPLVLLTDINMPQMGGLDLIRWLRQSANFSHLPVFVLTTSDHPEDVCAAYRLHVAGYLTKNGGQEMQEQIELLYRYWSMLQLPNRLVA